MNQIRDETHYRWASRHYSTPPIHRVARCRTAIKIINRERTARLVERSRRFRVTLNSVLGAAMLLAVYHHRYRDRPIPLRHIIFSGLRPYLKPPLVNENLGCYIAMTRLTVMVNPDQDLWSLARQVNDKFYRAAKRGDKFVGAAMVKNMMRVTLGLRAFRMGTTALSYMGVVELDAAYGPIRPVGLHTFVTNFTLGPEYAGLARIFAGKLWLDMLYLDADMDQAEAEAIADSLLRFIKTAIN